MSVFSIPVTIGIDEENITEEIRKNVEKQVVDKVYGEVKSTVFRGSYYGDNPVKDMVREQIRILCEEHQDTIIQGAINGLVDKMGRMKVVKEKVKEVCEEI